MTLKDDELRPRNVPFLPEENVPHLIVRLPEERIGIPLFKTTEDLLRSHPLSTGAVPKPHHVIRPYSITRVTDELRRQAILTDTDETVCSVEVEFRHFRPQTSPVKHRIKPAVVVDARIHSEQIEIVRDDESRILHVQWTHEIGTLQG